ncbi:MAG: penicillin-binding protein 1A [Desulfovibrionaceae bacterium]
MKKTFLYIAITSASLFAIGCIVGIILVTIISRELPDFKNLADYRPNLVTTIYAKDGSIIGELYKERRYLVMLKDIPQILINAFLAAEDRSFYQHDGVDFISIIRAFIINTWSGSVKQGGSTITQQVVKALLLSPERTYTRKLKEAILAYRLEKYLSKKEILTIYLNQIYLGAGAYGVEAASRVYFGKHVQEITLAEASMIAGLPKAPSRYSPYSNPASARQRQEYVLTRMYETNFITKTEYEEAMRTQLSFHDTANIDEQLREASQWYVEQVRQELVTFFSKENTKRNNLLLDSYGDDAIYSLGLNIYTPMNAKEQIIATKALRKGLEQLSKRRGWQGSVENISDISAQIALMEKLQKEFDTKKFSEGTWSKALVKKVTDKTALVQIGEYTGTVSLEDAGWARKIDVNTVVNKFNRPKQMSDILSVNDVIWVSMKRPKNKKDPIPSIQKEHTIPMLLEQKPIAQGALLSLDVKTGDVLAMSGGYDFAESKFNRALQAKRQSGSAFKPVVYSTALDKGYTAGTLVLDSPVAIIDPVTNKLWRPSNYQNKFFGYMLFRSALAQSRNLCTIRIAQDVGVGNIIKRAKELQLEGNYPNELGISLGAAETTLVNLVEAYTAFADSGIVSKRRFISSIKDAAGYTLYEFPINRVNAISPQNAYIMQSLLKSVISEGTGSPARWLNIPVAGKTGTSNDEKDAWFVGFTPHTATGVFVGFDQAAPLGKYEGGTKTALPIFIDFQEKVKNSYPKNDFEMPEDIIIVRIDAKTGLLPGNKTNSTLFLPYVVGTEPKQTSTGNPTQQKDNASTDLLKEVF